MRRPLTVVILGLLLVACGGPEPASKTPVIVIGDDSAEGETNGSDRDRSSDDPDDSPMTDDDDGGDDDGDGDNGEDQMPDDPEDPAEQPRTCDLECPAPAPRCRGVILEVPRGTATCNDDTFQCEGETWDEIRCADSGQICSSGACIDTPKRTFLTVARYDGDLLSATAEFDGAAAADALCQLEADGALLGGNWKAWISTFSEDAIDRISDNGPWYLVDGSTLVANNLAELATSGPRTDIDMHPNRATVGDFGAWTGTGTSGRWTGEDCNEWSTSVYEVEGTFGVSTVVSTALGAWTERGGGDCDIRRHLYCIEQ